MRGIGATNTKKELRELGIQPSAVLSIADLLERTMRESHVTILSEQQGCFEEDSQFNARQNCDDAFSHIFHFSTLDLQRIASGQRR